MNMMKTMMILMLVAAFASCGRQGEAQSQTAGKDGKVIRVVTTTGMIGDAVKNVGGDRVEVTTLMGPGIDPHLYKASEGDVTRMASANMIFYNGLHLEGKMGEIFEKMSSRVKTVAVASEIDPALLQTPEAYEGNFDPHIWFDVSLWMQAVAAVKDALVEYDEAHAEIYRQNAAAYLNELVTLHQYVQDQAERINAETRVLVTAHDAFNYFGTAYGFQVRGLQGISTAAETGTADVQDLADFIVERRIPAMFVETSVSPRYIEALQAAVKSKGFEVEIGGKLFSDAMGDPGTPEGTYVGMVRHNIDTIVKALLKVAS